MQASDSTNRPQAILIAGPTASGKSELAVRLARRHGGVVVNADSMQVYNGISVLTAQPDAQTMASVAHKLFGHVPPNRAYSVAQWLRDAEATVVKIRESGAIPVFVGGTGLYFRALEQGLSDVPAPRPEIRKYWRERAVAGDPDLHAELAARDPVAAAEISPGDRQRIVRSLEVFDSTGKSISHFRGNARHSTAVGEDAQRLVLEVPPAQLRQRIDARFDRMMADGALAEVRSLARRGLDRQLPAMKAIGVQQLLSYLDGSENLADAVRHAKTATRQYAKRQRTWFRNQLDERWMRITAGD